MWFVEAGGRLLVESDAGSYKVQAALQPRRPRGTPVILQLTPS